MQKLTAAIGTMAFDGILRAKRDRRAIGDRRQVWRGGRRDSDRLRRLAGPAFNEVNTDACGSRSRAR